MNVYKYSSTSRPLDPKYKTNAAIIIITLFTIVGGTFIHMVDGVNLWPHFVWSLGAAFSVFITWAIARELDPDHNYAAFAGVAIIAFAVIFRFYHDPSFLILVQLLLLFRILNRSVGPPAKIFDSVMVLLIGSYLSFFETWIIGLVTAIAFFLDSQLPDPLSKQKWFASIMFIVTVIALFVEPGQVLFTWEMFGYLLVSFAIFIPVFFLRNKVESLTDITGEKINQKRIYVVQILALFTLISIIIWYGEEGFLNLLPLWSSVAGIAFYRVFVAMRLKLVRT